MECAAKVQPQQDQPMSEEGWYDRNTTYSYRNRYYSRTSYVPYYYGGYYATQDYRSFDQQNAVSPDTDDSKDLINS